MAIEECPHCIRKVVFPENGKCPSCGESKYIQPLKNRDQILFEKERNETQLKVDFLGKRGRRLIVGGAILCFLVLVITIYLIINNTFIIFWYGGFIIGFLMIGKGLYDLRTKNDLKYFYKKKYKIELSE